MAYMYAAQFPPPDMPGARKRRRSGQDPGTNEAFDTPHTGETMTDEQGRTNEPQVRGRRPYKLATKMELYLIRLFNYTDVPFDGIADAVERSHGPKYEVLTEISVLY
jgi:hypothetical protein